MGTRREQPDALEKSSDPRWLVVRDRASRPLEYKALAPGSDLRAAMAAKHAQLTATGWRVDSISRKRAFFFADRENERMCVSVECFEPAFTAGQGLRR